MKHGYQPSGPGVDPRKPPNQGSGANIDWRREAMRQEREADRRDLGIIVMAALALGLSTGALVIAVLALSR